MRIINQVGKYRKGEWSKRDTKGIKYFAVHHSATRQSKDDATALATLRDIHYKNGWIGLSYHYVIPKSGKIYKINDIDDLTWTVGATYNRVTISVCLEGYFHPPYNEKPTTEQLKALEYLLDRRRRDIKVVAHRDLSSTACCGDILYKYVNEYKRTNNIKTEQSSMPTRISTTSRIVKDFLKVHSDSFVNSVNDYVKLENEKQGEGVRQMIRDLIQANEDFTDQVNELQKQLEDASKVIEIDQVNVDNVSVNSEQKESSLITDLQTTVKEQDETINQMITGVYKASQMEKWSWNKFFVGLSKFGFVEALLSFGIAYLVTLSGNPEYAEYAIYLGLGISALKSIKQNIK